MDAKTLPLSSRTVLIWVTKIPAIQAKAIRAYRALYLMSVCSEICLPPKLLSKRTQVGLADSMTSKRGKS